MDDLDLGDLVRIHHLNCGTFRPTKALRLVTHVLVCVFNKGVVLVDTGFGTADIRDRRHRLGHSTIGIKPALSIAETARHQLVGMGLADNVQLIVGTHLDLDHLGGATDFNAPVLVSDAELVAAHARRSVREKLRYRPAQLREIGERLTTCAASPGDLTRLPIGVDGVRLDRSGALWLGRVS